MRLDELSKSDIAEQLRRLRGAYPGMKMSDQDLESFASELRIATRQWSRQDLVEAVSASIQEERYFPRISAIVHHRPRAHRPVEPDAASSSTCRRCHREAYPAAYQCADGRLVQRFRCDCDPGQPGWYTEAAVQANHAINQKAAA